MGDLAEIAASSRASALRPPPTTPHSARGRVGAGSALHAQNESSTQRADRPLWRWAGAHAPDGSEGTRPDRGQAVRGRIHRERRHRQL